MTDQHTHIVVIGGGYAGTLAANHLRLRADVDITLVNPRPVFVERIRLHQLVAGSGIAAVDYGTLLGEGIRLVVDNAERINTADATVELASGAVLDYDYLIYAVGSTGAVPTAVPGAVEFAYPIAELEHAERLRDALDELTSRRARHRGRRRVDRHRDRIRAGRAGPAGDPGLRRGAGAVAEPGRPAFGGQVAAPPRRGRAGDGGGPRGSVRRGGADRRRRAAQRGDGVDGGLRRAGAGCPQRASHRRAGPAAHR